MKGPFVRVGATNRDKRPLLSGLEPPTGTKGVLLSRLVLPPGTKCPEPFVPVGATNRNKRGSFCPGWCLQPGQKAPVLPAGPVSGWTRDKSHLLSRAQRQPGQIAWNKDLFCSSALNLKGASSINFCRNSYVSSSYFLYQPAANKGSLNYKR